MINKKGQPPGRQRGNRQRFPYEPCVIGGKLFTPAELSRPFIATWLKRPSSKPSRRN
jgi:hypothetical protein